MAERTSGKPSKPDRPKPDWKGKDLSITGATPEELARRVLTGGAPRRTETTRQ